MLPHHYETSGFVAASPDRLFAHLDDHTQLSSHMSEPSWKMGGGTMELQLDEQKGRAVGSRIRLAGRAFGITLFVEESVTERDPPHRKVWETLGTPKLLVIGGYRLGFEVSLSDGGSMLRVFIEYALPKSVLPRWFGMLLGERYAKWCTHQMLEDARAHFKAMEEPASARGSRVAS